MGLPAPLRMIQTGAYEVSLIFTSIILAVGGMIFVSESSSTRVAELVEVTYDSLRSLRPSKGVRTKGNRA